MDKIKRQGKGRRVYLGGKICPIPCRASCFASVDLEKLLDSAHNESSNASASGGICTIRFESELISGQSVYHPDSYRVPRNTRPDSRDVARCYSCGTTGHFSKDSVCLPGAREAYQAATAQGQMGQASGQQAAISYVPSGAGGGN